mgnify:CR=1 FL=1
MAKLQYGINEEILKNMVIARKAEIRVKVKYTTVNKEVKQENDYEDEIEM